MTKIKIKDLTKGIKVTEEELKQIRGGLVKKPLPPGYPTPWFPRPTEPTYYNYEICQYVQAMACGCPG